MKIIANIPYFKEKYCSPNTQYILYANSYVFIKKQTTIKHNEFGPAWENIDGTYAHYINNQLHRLNNPAHYGYIYSPYKRNYAFYVINQFAGNSYESFVNSLNYILIPKYHK